MGNRLPMEPAALAELCRRHRIRKLSLFGSILKGTARPDSDVDLLVEFEEATYDHYMDLKFHLEEVLGVEVDLVVSDALKPRLRPRVLQEAVFA